MNTYMYYMYLCLHAKRGYLFDTIAMIKYHLNKIIKSAFNLFTPPAA